MPSAGTDAAAASRKAAAAAARLFNRLVDRGEDRARAQRFVLHRVFHRFAEMLDVPAAQANRLFRDPGPIPLNDAERALLAALDKQPWPRVEPPIFGALFETSLGKAERHALGAHFTSEADILKIIHPTITRPWETRIHAARTLEQLHALHAELLAFRVLDPACGCGNFLYTAHNELHDLELQIHGRIRHEFGGSADLRLRLTQFYGLDINAFAVELTRVTLMLGRAQLGFLNIDSLDANIIEADALISPWPEVDAIIGNPPFMDARKFAMERPASSMADVRQQIPGVPGRADLCTYFFRKTHDHLKPGQRAGLVGTNTIRQNYAREGGLDHIVANGGTITDAVATQVWSGDAAVHVSIVNWIKGPYNGPCELTTQLGDAQDSPWRTESVPRIPSSLSPDADVASARTLAACSRPFCFEGIQPGHRGFRLTAEDRRRVMHQDPRSRDLLSPYMNGDDLLSGTYIEAPEYLIDFAKKSLTEARAYPALFAHLEQSVLPDWQQNAENEHRKTGKNSGEHQNRLKTWWQLKRPRPELQQALRRLPRYIACSRVTKRPIFAFLHTIIKPDSSLTVFAAADDYSFGILQSSTHWAWFQARCSTLKGDFRYTSNTVFDSFAWPQSPTPEHVQAVARAAVELRAIRDEVQEKHGWSLRTLYRTVETEGDHPLRAAQDALDATTRTAYGILENDDPLAFLLHLNHDVSDHEARHQPVTGPGLPPCVTDPEPFVTTDCIKV
jgi:hypothetical protein